jgi:hypothetical protein
MNETQAIERMRQVIRRQHKALATEDACVLWLRRYMKALRQIPPELSSEKKMEEFLTDLAVEHDVSARAVYGGGERESYSLLLCGPTTALSGAGPRVSKCEQEREPGIRSSAIVGHRHRVCSSR